MEGKKNIKENFYTAVLYVIYAVGIIGHILAPFREIMLSLTSFTLLLTGGLVIINIAPKNKKLIQWIIATYLFTLLLEIAGVKTGLIFGEYHYGEVLKPKIFETPVIIGMNWVLVILGSIKISKRYFNNGLLIILTTALLAVLFDFIMEPVAIKLDYWQWENNTIPLKNYFAWFLIALAFSAYFVYNKIEIRPSLIEHYFIVQAAFFLILNVAL
ncbi:MAG: carotenoid biosynthesis protein [Melioribacteraceae bacterium]|nr:carotenoid biosynthesis protein [Melioribacteraceae bacterium]